MAEYEMFSGKSLTWGHVFCLNFTRVGGGSYWEGTSVSFIYFSFLLCAMLHNLIFKHSPLITEADREEFTSLSLCVICWSFYSPDITLHLCGTQAGYISWTSRIQRIELRVSVRPMLFCIVYSLPSVLSCLQYSNIFKSVHRWYYHCNRLFHLFVGQE